MIRINILGNQYEFIYSHILINIDYNIINIGKHTTIFKEVILPTHDYSIPPILFFLKIRKYTYLLHN